MRILNEIELNCMPYIETFLSGKHICLFKALAPSDCCFQEPCINSFTYLLVADRWLLDRGESHQSLDNLIESSSIGVAGAADAAPIPHLDEKTWLIKCNRNDAERLLHSRSDGTFLIRPSSIAPYALSIM